MNESNLITLQTINTLDIYNLWKDFLLYHRYRSNINILNIDTGIRWSLSNFPQKYAEAHSFDINHQNTGFKTSYLNKIYLRYSFIVHSKNLLND